LAAYAVGLGRAGALELAKLLVEKGAKVDTGGDDGDGESSPLWLTAMAVLGGTAGGLELATLLVETGADVNAAGECEGEKGTPLRSAAAAVEANTDDAHELLRLLLSKGATLADDKLAEHQKHVDTIHEKCSVPVHKRYKDFQMEAMAKETVECPICMEAISRSAEFVESRLCFHVVCIRCYASNMLTENQSCARCACIKCPQCRKCTASCSS
jgi:hypothetical protein